MSNIVQDLAVLLFSAGEELEKKAEEFRENRENRQKEFEAKMEARREEFKEKCEGEFHGAREKLADMAANLGLATKAEVDELKEMIRDLSNKIDSLKQ